MGKISLLKLLPLYTSFFAGVFEKRSIKVRKYERVGCTGMVFLLASQLSLEPKAKATGTRTAQVSLSNGTVQVFSISSLRISTPNILKVFVKHLSHNINHAIYI